LCLVWLNSNRSVPTPMAGSINPGKSPPPRTPCPHTGLVLDIHASASCHGFKSGQLAGHMSPLMILGVTRHRSWLSRALYWCSGALSCWKTNAADRWQQLLHLQLSSTSRFVRTVLSLIFSAICCRPSVCLSSVCLSVCNVRAPYSGGSNFRQYFYGIMYIDHPLTSTENFMEIVQGEPLGRGSYTQEG